MEFDHSRYPNAVTFQWLLDNGLDVGLHCHPCGRHVVVPVHSLPIPVETPVPCVRGSIQMHTLRIKEDRGAAGVA